VTDPATGAVEVLDPDDGKVRPLATKLADAELVGWTHDASALGLRSGDGTLYLFDTSSSKRIAACGPCKAGKGARLRLSPDGKRVAFSLLPAKNELRVLEVSTGKASAVLKPFGGAKPPEGADGVAMELDFAPDGSRAVAITYFTQGESGSESHEAALLDTKTWKPVEAAFDRGADAGSRGAYFFDTLSKWIVAAGSSALEVRVWDARSAKKVRAFPMKGARNLRFAADGKRIVAFEGAAGELVDLEGKVVFRFGSNGSGGAR
jgi:WD40 repeat protein